jgi:hypothetical protein
VGCKGLTYAIMDHLDEVKKEALENEQVIITE